MLFDFYQNKKSNAVDMKELKSQLIRCLEFIQKAPITGLDPILKEKAETVKAMLKAISDNDINEMKKMGDKLLVLENLPPVTAKQ